MELTLFLLGLGTLFTTMGKGGVNCCVPQCTNYYDKTKDMKISYVGFPKKGCGDDEWRSKLIAAVSREGKHFHPENAKICTAHFDPKCLLFHGKGYKLVKNSLPMIAMPKKSIQRQLQEPRKSPLQRPPPEIPMRVTYMEFSELITDSKKLSSPWAVLHSTPEKLVIGKIDVNYETEITIIFDGDFIPTIRHKGLKVDGCYDVEVHGLRKLCKGLEEMTFCPGSEPRAKKCSVVVDIPGLCFKCELVQRAQKEKDRRPLPVNAPLSSASVPALIQEVRSVRAQLKSHETELLRIQKKLETETVYVSEDIKEGLDQVMQTTKIDDPFLKLFWEEQNKASSRDPRGMRWHPMMVRFAIYMHYQSPRAYEALRNTGVLHLPNKSTLRDYTSFFAPKEGFQAHVFDEIKSFAKHLPEEKKFVALLHDEMTVREDLVYDRRGGQIVGFINPHAWNFKKESETMRASHVLVFMAVGINNHLKQSLGYFATHTATADMLFPLMWEAIAYLEQQGLKVITSTSDKASPNQKLYRMHGEGIVHETINPYAEDEERPVYFISDPPHLVKTIRNNLEKSRLGGTRCLWNRGKHLLWEHIYKLYMDDLRRQLRMSKLRNEHVHLTPSSRMSVHLAAQVLSRSVGKLLLQYYPAASETGRLILLCDRFFDCLNTRSFTEHTSKRKPDLAPYRSAEDERFQFLEDFLKMIEEWRENVEARNGYTQAQKEKMFLSAQTYEGIVTTVRGFTGAAKFLLNHGVPYIFSNVFCQDPIEECFGRHRGLGRRSRNPSVFEFGHQDNQIRLQRTLAFRFEPKGNTAGRHREREPIKVEEQPLAKIKRH